MYNILYNTWRSPSMNELYIDRLMEHIILYIHIRTIVLSVWIERYNFVSNSIVIFHHKHTHTQIHIQIGCINAVENRKLRPILSALFAMGFPSFVEQNESPNVIQEQSISWPNTALRYLKSLNSFDVREMGWLGWPLFRLPFIGKCDNLSLDVLISQCTTLQLFQWHKLYVDVARFG